MPSNEFQFSDYWAIVCNNIPVSTLGLAEAYERLNLRVTLTSNLYIQCMRKKYGNDL